MKTNNKIYSLLKEANILETDWKNTIVIGDIHFGIKNNSTQWLLYQEKLFKEQIFPILENANEYNISDVVILGDVFDIRASVNIVTAIKVKSIIKEMCLIAQKSNVNVYVIAGNHDFYSPDEKYKRFNAYSAVFGDEFSLIYKNIKFVTDKTDWIYKLDDNQICLGRVALLPWYETSNKENFKTNLSYIINEKHETVYGCYCHTDLVSDSMNPDLYDAFRRVGIPFWSGHIHFVTKSNIFPLYNIGACMQYNFGDADSERYIYIINEKENKSVAIKNTVTPKFYRIGESELFDDSIFNKYIKEECFIELQISVDNISKLEYSNRISELRVNIPNAEISVKSIIDGGTSAPNSERIIYSDIESYIFDNTPDNLKDNLYIIKEKLNEEQE